MTTQKSEIEKELKQQINQMQLLLRIADVQYFQNLFSRVLREIEELRNERDLWRKRGDNWKRKFEELIKNLEQERR